MSEFIHALGIENDAILREIFEVHEHCWRDSGRVAMVCSCGAWPKLVQSLEKQGIPADKMNLDVFLRQANYIVRVTKE